MPVRNSNSAIEKWLSILGLGLLFAVSLGVTAEVVCRKLFSVSLGGIDELSGYAFSIFTSFAFVLAALEKSNIRIDLLRVAAARPAKIAMDLIASLALLGFVSLLSARAVLLAINSFEKGSRAITPLATPLYIPQAIWAAGLSALTLTLLFMLLRALRALFARDLRGFWSYLAPTHEEEQAVEYTHPATETGGPVSSAKGK